MGDDAGDFEDYLASLRSREEAEASRASREESRRKWRETSWAGYFVTSFESMGVLGFFEAIGRSLSDQEGGNSPNAIILRNVARIAILFAVIVTVYSVGRLVQMVVGKEIVVEQEVIIVEEVHRSQGEAEEQEREGDTDAPTGADRTRNKASRGKRSKAGVESAANETGNSAKGGAANGLGDVLNGSSVRRRRGKRES